MDYGSTYPRVSQRRANEKLMRAVKRGDVDGVRSALKAGASANYTAEGTISQWTPLLHTVGITPHCRGASG